MTMKPKLLFIAHAANIFQIGAHGALGQKRKFSGKPYHTHPQAVAGILKAHYPEATPYDLAAAFLHDVIEDTGFTYEDLVHHFGEEIAGVVRGLTNVKVPGLNRAQQKQHDAQRIAGEVWIVKLIKLCDRLHNLPDIIENDPKHAAVYVPETRYLLDTALTGVHEVLWNKLDKIVCDYFAKNA